jgi:hypothetical protein
VLDDVAVPHKQPLHVEPSPYPRDLARNWRRASRPQPFGSTSRRGPLAGTLNHTQSPSVPPRSLESRVSQ